MIGGFIIQGSGRRPWRSLQRAVAHAVRDRECARESHAHSRAPVRPDGDRHQRRLAVRRQRVATSGRWFAPSNKLESAIYVTLPPGAYTAVLSGAAAAPAVGIIGVYKVN
jgi:hypothetical protein